MVPTHCVLRPLGAPDDVQYMVESVPDHPNIWSDGSREPIPHLNVEVAGAFFFTRALA